MTHLGQSGSVLDAPGWPRPWRMWEPDEWKRERGAMARLLPVPWINGSNIEKGDWLSFPDDRDRAHHDRLCAVCGEHMAGAVVLGAFMGLKETSGPGGHPRCMLMAVLLCPHFQKEREEDAPVAWLHRGDGPGYVVEGAWKDEPYIGTNDVVPTAEPLTVDALKKLAKAEPLGVAA